MRNKDSTCPGFECPAASLFQMWAALRREYWLSRASQNKSPRSLPAGWEESSKNTPERGTHFSEPALHDPEDIEEFPLLLPSADVSALIEAARRQGLCAPGLARLVIQDYLLRTRSDLARTMGHPHLRLVGGEGR
jgi:hypothetical protein